MISTLEHYYAELNNKLRESYSVMASKLYKNPNTMSIMNSFQKTIEMINLFVSLPKIKSVKEFYTKSEQILTSSTPIQNDQLRESGELYEIYDSNQCFTNVNHIQNKKLILDEIPNRSSRNLFPDLVNFQLYGNIFTLYTQIMGFFTNIPIKIISFIWDIYISITRSICFFILSCISSFVNGIDKNIRINIDIILRKLIKIILSKPLIINKLFKYTNSSILKLPELNTDTNTDTDTREVLFNICPLLITMVYNYNSYAEHNFNSVGSSLLNFSNDFKVIAYGTYEKNKLLYLVINRASDIFVVFRGTNSLLDIMLDAYATKNQFNIISSGNNLDDDIRIHDGCEQIYQDLYNLNCDEPLNFMLNGSSDSFIPMTKNLTDYLNEKLSDCHKLIITGHSLGAGLASICAYHLIFKNNPEYYNKIYLEVYSSISVGNNYLNIYFNDTITSNHFHSYRIKQDIVPLLSIDFTTDITDLNDENIGIHSDDSLFCINGNIDKSLITVDLDDPTINKKEQTIFTTCINPFDPFFYLGLYNFIKFHSIDQYLEPNQFKFFKKNPTFIINTDFEMIKKIIYIEYYETNYDEFIKKINQ